MKSPLFDYVKPKNLTEVFGLMAQYGDDARIIAGGQTLLATLNMRLSEPQLLIDINGLDELKGLVVKGNCLHIGALVTHTEIEESALVATHVPMLSQAAPHIAHRAIRNLGTLGGSIAFADPAAEWPVCALALDATIVLLSKAGERRVDAKDFFQGLYVTSANADEIVCAVEFPLLQAGETHDFSELARRHGDYAVVGLAVRTSNKIDKSDLSIAFLGLADRPIRAYQAEAIFRGTTRDAGAVKISLENAMTSLGQEINIIGDLTHTKETKLHIAGVLLKRAVGRLFPKINGATP
jgi:aerobic carbon-monoxide dehydrogenase medium subunit